MFQVRAAYCLDIERTLAPSPRICQGENSEPEENVLTISRIALRLAHAHLQLPSMKIVDNPTALRNNGNSMEKRAVSDPVRMPRDPSPHPSQVGSRFGGKGISQGASAGVAHRSSNWGELPPAPTVLVLGTGLSWVCRWSPRRRTRIRRTGRRGEGIPRSRCRRSGRRAS